VLCLIKGAAKSGKTTEIYNRIKAAVDNGKKALLIVPEQASFYNERKLEQLGSHKGQAKAMSFSRFAQRISEQFGGCDKPQASTFAEYFLMSTALDEVSDQLEVYKKNYYTKGFIEQILSAVSELENAGISPQRLGAAALSLEQPDARNKLSELAMIYDSYTAVMSRSYLSQCDIMKNAAQKLVENSVLGDTEIFIDDFSGFTAPELELIAAFISNADKVTVSLYGGEQSCPAWQLSEDTERRLMRMAADCGKKVEKAVLTHSFFESKALTLIEKSQRQEMKPDTDENDGAVRAFICDNGYDELETAAAEIRLLVFEGMRYRDIAVIARDMGRYSAAIESVFGRFEIPFFVDDRTDARTALLTNGLLAAIKIACGARDADWLDAARSPLMGLDRQQINRLENYCYVWSVKPAQWKKDFVKNPSGMAGEMTDSDRELLNGLNEARAAVTEPILTLSKELKSGSGGKIARGIWSFLQQTAADRRIKEFADQIPDETERRTFIDEQQLLWDQLVDLLELFDSLDDSVSFLPERVCELTELCFGGFEVSLIPRTLDQVTVGTAQRMRAEDAKAVFLLGAVQGEFPALSKSEGLISEQERRLLAESGLDLLNEGDRRQDTEKMFCYRAVTASQKLLFVSCPKRELSGEELLPSEIFEYANRLTALRKDDPCAGIWSKEGLKRAIVSADESTRKSLKSAGVQLLGEAQTEQLCGFEKPQHKISDRNTAKALFGREIRISPSRLEQYYRCPFSFFIQKGLGIRKLSKAELSPANSGTIIHLILERLVTEKGRGLIEITDADLMAAIRAEALNYMRQCAGSLEEVTARMMGNVELLCGRIFEMIKNLAEELAQSEFIPAAFEMKIGRYGDVKSVELTTAEGNKIYAEGTVDRVDVANIDGQDYIRIIDYKSGAKKFEIEDVSSGLNLQMLIYLFSLTAEDNDPKNGRWHSPDAAAALYLPAQSSYVTVKHGTSDGEIAKSVKDQYRMNGLMLNDERILSAMEQNLEGRFIPYKQGVKPRGENPLYTAEELHKLRGLVFGKIEEMAERLYSGEIAAMPLVKNQLSPCSYCDYKSACGFEEGDEVRQHPALSRQEILGMGGEADGSKN